MANVDSNERLHLLNSGKSQIVQSKFKWYVDPVIFFLFISIYFSETVLRNQILVQTCIVTFNQSKIQCSNIGSNYSWSGSDQDIAVEIQKYCAKVLMVASFINNFITTLISLLAGSFADKIGRRPILILSCCSTLLYYGILCFLSYLTNSVRVDPWIFGLAIFVFSIGGGYSTILITGASITTDTSIPEKRSLRMTIFSAVMQAGIFSGYFLNSIVIKYLSPFQVFLISFCSALVATAYTIIFVKETIIVKSDNNKTIKENILNFFSFKSIKDLIHTLVRKRENQKHRRMWVLISNNVFWLFILIGQLDILYLFELKVLDWTVENVNSYNSFKVMTSFIGCLCGIFILKNWLNILDKNVIMLALFSNIIQSFVVSFSTTGWHMYLAAGFGSLTSLIDSVSNSLLTNIVDSNEVGKLFSTIHFFQSIFSMAASPIYTFAYTSTIETFPGAFSLLTAGIFTVNLTAIFFSFRKTS